MDHTENKLPPRIPEPRREARSLLLKAGAVLLVLIAAFALSRYLEEKNRVNSGAQRQRIYAPMVEEDHPLLVRFEEQHPQRRVVLACQEDVTNDGQQDLLIIYKEEDPQEGEITRLVVAQPQADGGTLYTEPIPAPIENQGIQFKNIDQEAEMEFIVSGEKDGNAGYAIYRMMDGAPVDLFGDGMDACC